MSVIPDLIGNPVARYNAIPSGFRLGGRNDKEMKVATKKPPLYN